MKRDDEIFLYSFERKISLYKRRFIEFAMVFPS